MEDKFTKPEEGSGVFAAPLNASLDEKEHTPFDWRRLIPCLASYLAGWFFVRSFEHTGNPCWPLLILGVIFTVWTLCTGRGRKRSVEQWLWLGAMWAMLIYMSFGAVGFSWGQ